PGGDKGKFPALTNISNTLGATLNLNSGIELSSASMTLTLTTSTLNIAAGVAINPANDLTIQQNSTATISGPHSLDDFMVTDNSTVTMDGVFTFDTVTLSNSGTILVKPTTQTTPYSLTINAT